MRVRDTINRRGRLALYITTKYVFFINYLIDYREVHLFCVWYLRRGGFGSHTIQVSPLIIYHVFTYCNIMQLLMLYGHCKYFNFILHYNIAKSLYIGIRVYIQIGWIQRQLVIHRLVDVCG